MPIQKTIEAVVVVLTLDKLREISPKIYSDEINLQRLLSKWPDKVLSNHLSSFLKGQSNIYPIVLVNIDGCLNYCEEIITNYVVGDTQHTAIQDTIDYLKDLKDKNFTYLNIDGQHRIDCYTRYLNDEFSINESIVNKWETENDGFLSEDIKGKKFSELSTNTQEEILSYELTSVIIKKGTLQDLVDVTIYTNIGEPWNDNERRIIISSEFNRKLHKYLIDNPFIRAMFSNMKKLDGDYSLKKKGDSLMICEWQGFWHNNCEGQWYQWPLKQQLDDQSSIIGTNKQSKTRISDCYSIITKMGNIISKSKSKHDRSFFDNLFILLTIINKPDHPKNSRQKQIKINESALESFYDWFAKIEAECKLQDKYAKDSKGNILINPVTKTKLTNSESFSRKCGDKKIGSILYRAEKLIEKFDTDFKSLFASGVISQIDTKNFSKNDKLRVAIELDWIDADGKVMSYDELMGSNSIIEGDHIDARSTGGETTDENLTLRRKVANIRKSNKKLLK
jgi:hypothetical protein